MLVLTRSLYDNVKIGDDITVRILGVKGGQVKLGIDAPKDIPVHREEIYNKILAQKGGDRDGIFEGLTCA